MRATGSAASSWPGAPSSSTQSSRMVLVCRLLRRVPPGRRPRRARFRAQDQSAGPLGCARGHGRRLRAARRTGCGREGSAGSAQAAAGLRRHRARRHREVVGARVRRAPDRRLAQGGAGGGGTGGIRFRGRPRDAVAIAVLPFSDMSAAKDQEYLCEGMAEEIMNALVRIDGIRVASRTSAFRARQEGSDLAAIARALSVDHVLEGSVRTCGQPASRHRAADRRRERLPALVGAIRSGGCGYLRRPGRDRRRRRRSGQGAARAGGASDPRPDRRRATSRPTAAT